MVSFTLPTINPGAILIAPGSQVPGSKCFGGFVVMPHSLAHLFSWSSLHYGVKRWHLLLLPSHFFLSMPLLCFPSAFSCVIFLKT